MKGFDVIQLDHLRDGRGFNTHPIDYDLLASGKVSNVHIVSLAPGAARGNHTHHRQTEYIFIMGGPCLVAARNNDTGEEFDLVQNHGQVQLYRVEAGVAHVFKNIGKDTIYALCYSDLRYDPDNPDILPTKVL